MSDDVALIHVDSVTPRIVATGWLGQHMILDATDDIIGIKLDDVVLVGPVKLVQEKLAEVAEAVNEYIESLPLVVYEYADEEVGPLYVGPLKPAFDYVRKDFIVHETFNGRFWLIELCDMDVPHQHPTGGLCPHTSDYGSHEDYEQAWRLCLGAEFGTQDPVDYDDDNLRAVLKIKKEGDER